MIYMYKTLRIHTCIHIYFMHICVMNIYIYIYIYILGWSVILKCKIMILI